VHEGERTTGWELRFIGGSQISRWRSAGEVEGSGGVGGGAGGLTRRRVCH
jgi:hypothetical protein